MANGFSVPHIGSTVDVGRIKDFVNGINEASDSSLKTLGEGLAMMVGVNTWSAYGKWVKGKK